MNLGDDYGPTQTYVATAAESEGRRATRPTAAAPTLSMPAAEPFGIWAVAEAVSRASGERPQAVIAIGDCDPAAAEFNAASSGAAQLRAILASARGRTRQWLA
eukprot:3875212-Pleurochrysis_carterae.AAC.1